LSIAKIRKLRPAKKLTIKQIRREFSGWLADRLTGSYCINSNFIPQFSLDKPEGVTISTRVTQNTVKQGQTVTFTCNVNDAFPSVSQYKFYLNGSIRTVTNVNKFTIVGVNRSQHFGEYKCEAHSAAQDEQSDGVRLNINGESFF